MVGTLAQLIALVSYGNAHLNGHLDLCQFYPDNSTFQFCNSVTFVDVKRFLRAREDLVSKNPNEWFSWLKENRSLRLYLAYTPTPNPELPDYVASAFVGGGGTWHISANFGQYSDYWRGRWEVTDQNAPDSRIWKVTYGRVASRRPVPEYSVELNSCKEKFRSVLEEIQTFALEKDLGHFATCFQAGLDALDSVDSMSFAYHRDIVPASGYSGLAKQLLAASSAAWVFGGMGSWNDMGFDGEEQNAYERLSEELYSVINLSIEQSVNSYQP